LTWEGKTKKRGPLKSWENRIDEPILENAKCATLSEREKKREKYIPNDRGPICAGP